MSVCQFEVHETFESFHQFMTKLKAYESQNCVLYVKSTAKKLADHPDSAKHEYELVKFECKQGSRRKSASKGIRPNQRTIKCDCNSYIRLVRCKVGDRYVLQVKAMNLKHRNHPVDHLTASVYPENRRVNVTDKLRAMCTSSVPRRQIQEFIAKEQNKNLLPQDVRNLIKKLRDEKPESDSADVERILKNIRGEGGNTTFHASEDSDFKYLFYITKQMKRDLQMFGDILILHVFYKMNKYHFPLVSVLCIDSKGFGRPVLHGFVAEEDFHSLSSGLKFLKSACVVEPAVIFIDKDFIEINTVKETFPSTCIHHCAYHAADSVRKALHDLGLPAHDIGKLSSYFLEQRDTSSQQRYLDLRDLMSAAMPESARCYFEENWWSRPEVWAAHTTLDLQTFHVTCNNYIETYRNKFSLDSNKTMSESITALTYDKNFTHERDIKRHINNISCQYNVKDACPIVQIITSHLSPFASKVVLNQLSLARTMPYEIKSTSGGIYTVIGGVYESQVHSVTRSTCNCIFFSKFGLPCRHLFFVKKFLELPVCRPSDLTNSRFGQRITGQPTATQPSDSPSTLPKATTRSSMIHKPLSAVCSSTVHKPVTHSSIVYTPTSCSSISLPSPLPASPQTSHPTPLNLPSLGHQSFPKETNTNKGRFEIVSALTSQINWSFQAMSGEKFMERMKQLETFLDLVKQDRPFYMVEKQNSAEDSTVCPKTECIEVAPSTFVTDSNATKKMIVNPLADSTVAFPISKPGQTMMAYSIPTSKPIIVVSSSKPETRNSSALTSTYRVTVKIPSSAPRTDLTNASSFAAISLPSPTTNVKPKKRPNVDQDTGSVKVKRQAVSS